jgi:hypothetical protein
MASLKGIKKRASKGSTEIELVPDAWPRFEAFIREIVKAGPQHRNAKPKAKAGKSPNPKPKKASATEAGSRHHEKSL